MIHIAVRAVSLAPTIGYMRAMVFVVMLLATVVNGLVVRAVAGVGRSVMTVPTGSLARHQVHAAVGAGARLAPDDLRVHGAHVLGLGADRVHVKIDRFRGEAASARRR